MDCIIVVKYYLGGLLFINILLSVDPAPALLHTFTHKTVRNTLDKTINSNSSDITTNREITVDASCLHFNVLWNMTETDATISLMKVENLTYTDEQLIDAQHKRAKAGCINKIITNMTDINRRVEQLNHFERINSKFFPNNSKKYFSEI